MTETTLIRVLLADDHPVVRMGLATLIGACPDFVLVGEAADGECAVRLHQVTRPDVLVLDLRMPDMDGVDVILRIRREDPDARIIALTSYDGDGHIRRALEAGARGYLLKDLPPSALIDAIRTVSRGERALPKPVADRLGGGRQPMPTAREREVLALVAAGLSNKEIAQRLDRSEEVVKAHLKHLFAKLDVDDRTQAVTVGLARGFIQLP